MEGHAGGMQPWAGRDAGGMSWRQNVHLDSAVEGVAVGCRRDAAAGGRDVGGMSWRQNVHRGVWTPIVGL
jgi:hypothetical protein